MNPTDEFFKNNTAAINRLTARILLFMNLLGPLFAVGKFFGIFSIPYRMALITAILTVLFTSWQYFLIKRTDFQRAAMYSGLVGTAFIIGFLGTDRSVGIYIAYALIPVLSCLYYDVKFTNKINIISYVIILVSQYFRSFSIWTNIVDIHSPMQYFISMSAGFSIEFLFVFMITKTITKRCRRTLEQVYEANMHIEDIQMKLVKGFANLVESRDYFTGEHIKRTSQYVDIITRELVRRGFYTDILTEDTIKLYVNAAPLHDLGKIHVPDYILCKPDRFTPEEFENMKKHPAEGKKLIEENLKNIEQGDYLQIAEDMALYHHEKWDGTGYPNHVAGTDIPLCARIMAAADVLDALLSRRQYKEPMSIDEAIDIFEKSKGTHFEPCIADAVIASKPVIFMIAENPF